MRSAKRLFAVTVMIFMALPLVPSWSQQIGNIGFECQKRFGGEIVGIGSRSQTIVHYRVFINRFHASAERTVNARGEEVLTNYNGGCREDAQGLVHFQGENDSGVIRAMRTRAYDPLLRRYVFYGFSRPLTSGEKTRIETDAESLRPSLGNVVLQMPAWIDGLAIAHSLTCPTGNPGGALRLTSAALSQIFQGIATRWNDPAITPTNTGLLACDQTIRVAVRADVSDRTTVFKDYLSKRAPQWKPYMEPQLNTQWPPTLLNPCRGRGEDGVATCVAGQAGAIGYVAFPETFSRGLRTAQVENRSASFVAPTLEECTRAGGLVDSDSGASQVDPRYPPASGDWSGVSLTDPPIGYPICSLQFVDAFQIMNFSYGGQIGVDKVRSVKDYIKWISLTQTQDRLSAYHLVRLPESLRKITEDGAASIRYRE